MERGLTWLLLALCVLLPGSAWADDRYASAQTSRLHVEGAPAVELAADVICSDASSCSVELRWTIPPAREPRAAMLLMLRPEVEAITVDGKPLGFEVDADEYADFARVAFTLPASSEPLVLTLNAALPLHHRRLGCSLSGHAFADGRHPLTQREVYDVRLDVEPGVSPDDPPRVRYTADPAIRVEFPRGWSVARRDWSIAATKPRKVASSRGRQLAFNAAKHRIVHGPLLGAGAQIRGRTARPWLRGGWEFSAIDVLVHTAALESDLRRFTVVPSTEIGSRSLFVIPSASIGVGAPVRIAPRVRPGVRALGGLNFPFVSIVGGYDVFPELAGRATEHVGHVGLQFSL